MALTDNSTATTAVYWVVGLGIIVVALTYTPEIGGWLLLLSIVGLLIHYNKNGALNATTVLPSVNF